MRREHLQEIAEVLRGTNTVSYTHLDVYKRQNEYRTDIGKIK